MGTNQKHKIAILTDTGSYIYPKEAEELGIYLLPLQIVEDNKSYLDLFEIDTIDIYEKIYKGKALKTSLPSPYTIEKTINKIKEDGYDYILLIPLTTGISSTANTVKMIAESLNMTLKIIDTYHPYEIVDNILVLSVVDVNGEIGKKVKFRKIDNKEYSIDDIRQVDDVSYEFINDENVLGIWKSIAFT